MIGKTQVTGVAVSDARRRHLAAANVGAMMTLRAIHAGTGYQYLLRSVATNDAAQNKDVGAPSLADYYAAKGTPPGKWLGSGLADLQSATVVDGATIDEKQMAALYGEGLHPDANARMEAGESLDDVKLGRAFPNYTGKSDVLANIKKAEEAIKKTENRLPTEEERNDIALAMGKKFHPKADHELTGEEIIGWVNEQRDQVRQAVAGFDFTFSPTKSFSVMWALADRETASHMAALHHEAVAKTMERFEDIGLYTRRGVNGIEQVKTRGAIAAEFTHFDTRGGDPDLHSHVTVANKVQDADGNWLTVDSQMVHHMNQPLSAYYDATLQDLMTRHMGVDFEARTTDLSTKPVWEIAGIDQELIDRFSSRRNLARPVYDQYVAEYTARTNKVPSQRQSYDLWQKAILATRDAKKPAESLEVLREQWRSDAASVVGEDGIAATLEAAQDRSRTISARPMFDAARDTERVAREALKTVSGNRARFRASHIDTAVGTELKGYRFASDEARESAHRGAVHMVMAKAAISLSPAEPLALPSRLRQENGLGIDRRANSTRYTAASVLTAERKVLDAATEPVAVFASDKAMRKAMRRFKKSKGFALNSGQQRMAEHLVQAGTLVASGVGPAGTGKTASMRVVADAWKAEGHQVHALSTSKNAANILAGDIGAHDGHTIDSLTYTWRGRHDKATAKDVSKLPIELAAGDMLLVDEAGMAGTDNLAALTEIARESGAVVRLVGDPSQLDAVQTGGLFRDLARVPGTPMLDEVVRMGDDAAQADATLKLRKGNADGLELYDERGWIKDGSRAQMITDAADAYIADTRAGKSSLAIAVTNSDCDQLNALIRADRIDRGTVDASRETTVARGEIVGLGDTVLARENKIFLRDVTDDNGRRVSREAGRVANGDLFTVVGIADNGDIEVQRHGTRSNDFVVLPADYARANVHLGYAATVHRSQGTTVDTCHPVIDMTADRAAAYVAATRASESTHFHVVTEFDPDVFAEDAHMHSAGNQQPETGRDYLAIVLSHDRAQRSATTTLLDEAAETTAPQRLNALYSHGADIATQGFIDHELPTYIDRLPLLHSQELEVGTDGYAIVAAAWKAALERGYDPRGTWFADTSNIDDADSVAKLLSWRLREHLPDHGEGTVDLPHLPPAVAGSDRELAAWPTTTRATLDAGNRDAAADAAREKVMSKRVTQMPDDKLARTRIDYKQRLFLATARRDEAQAAVDHFATGPAVAEATTRHDRLDQRLAAIDRTTKVHTDLDHVHHQLRDLEIEREKIASERRELGPLAIARNRTLERQLHDNTDALKAVRQQRSQLRDAAQHMRGSAGDPSTWNAVRAEASEHNRAQAIVDATHRDHQDQQTAAERLRTANADVRRAEGNIDVIDKELARRDGLDTDTRRAENAVRSELAPVRPRERTRAASTSFDPRDLPPTPDRGIDHGPEAGL